MVLALNFHSKDPGRVGDSVNVFLFPDLYPSEGSEAAILMRRWYVVFGQGTLTSFAKTGNPPRPPEGCPCGELGRSSPPD